MNKLSKVGEIHFDAHALTIFGTLDEPYFKAVEVAKLIDYSTGDTHHMLELVEEDEKALFLPPTGEQKHKKQRGGANRPMWFLTELGLYNVLSQSRKLIARKWRRVVHQQLIEARKSRGMTIKDQFDEWDDLLDTVYFDEKTGILMQSVTVAGGDVEQVPYEE